MKRRSEQTAHATIDVSIATRANPPQPDENSITCTACGETRQFGGVARVKIVTLTAKAARAMETRENMLPLCTDCVGSPNVSSAVVRSYYPDIQIAEGGHIPTQ